MKGIFKEMIRKATFDEKNVIMDIIKNAVTDMEEKNIFQWDNIYPNIDVINGDISKETLFVYVDNTVRGLIVLNEHQDKEYADLKWKYNSDKILVIHRLCVSPFFQGQGIAKGLLKFAEEYGKTHGYSSIRLDAFLNNERACNMYKKAGYIEAGVVSFRKGKFYCFEKNLI